MKLIQRYAVWRKKVVYNGCIRAHLFQRHTATFTKCQEEPCKTVLAKK